MFPPVDNAVLQNNPEFAVVYGTLTTVILNTNGSTKNEPAAKERDAIRESLKTQRLKDARRHILVQAISAAAPSETKSRRPKGPRPEPSAPLPPELLDLLLLLPPLFDASTSLSAESTSLLLSNPPFSLLPGLLPQLAPLVASALVASASSLARVANPSTNASYLHRSIPALPAHVASLQATLAAHKAALSTGRLAASSALQPLLGAESDILTHLLRALEAKHSTVARSLELRAAEVALDAQRALATAEAVRAKAAEAVYTPQAQQALRNYSEHLRGAKGRVAEAILVARERLVAYGVIVDGTEAAAGDEAQDRAQERTMREMAKVHREMSRQLKEAKGDLGRLGRT